MGTDDIAFAIVQQGFSQKGKDVYVDKEGVMRWGDTKQEVYGFGVNYTAPFAHAYRSAGKLGVDLEKAIEQDVYHFARLGLDAFRYTCGIQKSAIRWGTFSRTSTCDYLIFNSQK